MFSSNIKNYTLQWQDLSKRLDGVILVRDGIICLKINAYKEKVQKVISTYVTNELLTLVYACITKLSRKLFNAKYKE